MGGAALRIQDINHDPEIDDDLEYWPYNCSYFHTVKGIILRGAIDYLKDLSDRDLTKDFLIQQGLVTASPTDEAIVIINARSRIEDAIRLLQSWKRDPIIEPEDRRPNAIPTELKSFMQFVQNRQQCCIVQMGSSEMVVPMHCIIRTMNSHPYKGEVIDEVEECPNSFRQLNFEGVYLMMSMWDNSQRITYQDAQKLIFMLDRIDKFCKWDVPDWYNGEGVLIHSRSLREFLGKCGEDQIILG